MTAYFQRQLVHYAEGHGDRVNGVMHMIGNPIIFIGVVLPLSLVPVPLLGVHISLAPILVIPAVLLWMSWDFGLGLGIAVAAVPLLWIAAAIAGNVSVLSMWIIAVRCSFSAGRCRSSVTKCSKESGRLRSITQCRASSLRCIWWRSSTSRLAFGPIWRRSYDDHPFQWHLKPL